MSVDLTASSAQFLVTSVALPAIGTGNYTQSVWVKRRIAGASFRTVIGLGGSEYQALLLTRNSGANIFSTYFTVATTRQFNSTIPLDTWVHLAITRSSGTVTGYVNGVAEATTHTITESVPSAVMSVGSSRASPGGDYFDGLIAGVAVWNSALTPAQLAQLAAGLSPTTLGGEHRYFPLDGTQGSVANGQHGLRGIGDWSGELVIGGGSPVWSADSPTWLSDDTSSSLIRRVVMS